MQDGYRAWLESQKYDTRTVSTQMAEIARVERHYGDLKQHFTTDRFRDLLLSLSYSADDSRRNRTNPSKIPISGDLRNNLASYRSAVQRYARFLDGLGFEGGHGDVPSSENAAMPAEDLPEERIGLERDLQATLRRSIEQLDPTLRIIDDGAERFVASGFIDITARDDTGALVVIELKAGVAGRAAVGQILSYMGDLADEEPGVEIRGILVAADFDTKSQSAARMVNNLILRRYGVRFHFSEGGRMLAAT